MTAPRAAPSPRRATGILVTAAAGTVGQAVVEALAEAGETVVAGMRDPRARLADGAKWASGTAAAAAGSRAHGLAGPGRPAGKPVRAPNQKPLHNPAQKPAPKPVTAAAGPAARVHGTPPAGHADHATAAGVDARAIVRAFDFGDRGTWPAALAGVDRVVLIRPLGVTDVARSVIPFIDAAMESGVRQLVLVSQLGLPLDTRSPQHAVEQYLKRTRAPYTVVRLNVLLQTLTTVCRDDIRRRNEIVLPAGGARMAFVDARDVARVIAAVLTEPGHLRKTHTLSGEQSLGYREVADILTQVLGRTVDYSAPNEDDYLTLLAKQGIPADQAAALQAGFRAVRRRGAMLPNRSIRRLTGRPATSVRRFIDDHKELWL